MAIEPRLPTITKRRDRGAVRARSANANQPTHQPLAFEGSVDRTNVGWSIRIPVRAEEVWVEKEPFVVEEVHITRDEQHRTEPVEGHIRREELRVTNTPAPRARRTPTTRDKPPR